MKKNNLHNSSKTNFKRVVSVIYLHGKRKRLIFVYYVSDNIIDIIGGINTYVQNLNTFL